MKIRRFISKVLLSEAIDSGKYAVVIHQWHDNRSGELYDIRGFNEALEASVGVDLFDEDESSEVKELLNNAILGMIAIKAPKKPCNGAWEVTNSAVKTRGLGRVIYDLGYSLSPTGKLMSDRHSLSQFAVNGWLRFSKNVEGDELDDIENPRNNDPNDDCYLWSGDPKGAIKQFNQRETDKLPPDAADALNRSYDKPVEGDWDRIEKMTTQRIFSTVGSRGVDLFRAISSNVADDLFEVSL